MSVIKAYNFDIQRYLEDMNSLIIHCRMVGAVAAYSLQLAGNLRRNNYALLADVNEKYHQIQYTEGWREYAEHLERLLSPSLEDDPLYRDVAQLAAWGER